MDKIQAKLLSMFLMICLSACSAADKMPQVREGMTQQELESIMGTPDGFVRSGEQTGLQYKNLLISGWSWDRADYGFIFDNDRLTGWGAGDVRKGNTPSALFIYNMRP